MRRLAALLLPAALLLAGFALLPAAAAEPAQRAAALALANELRHAGLVANLDLAGRSLKGQLKQADRDGARQTVILEGDGRATMRDMESGDQREVDVARIPDELKGA